MKNGTKKPLVVKRKATTNKPQTPCHSIKTSDKKQNQTELEQFSKIQKPFVKRV